MNNPRRMRRIERVSDLDRKGQKQIRIKGTSGDPVAQRHAIQKLHRNEGLAFLLTDVIDGADVGVVQGRRCFCLTPKPL